jgi:hypothetical protein
MGRRHDKRNRCAWCGETVSHAELFDYDLSDRANGTRVRLTWHLGCVDKDTEAQALFDIDSEREPTPDADTRFSRAYATLIKAIHDRPAEAVFAIDVRRDTMDTRYTLRAPWRWGLLTRRAGA